MGLEPIIPPGWKRARGYAHAIRADGRLHVAGVLPWDPATQRIEEAGDFVAQWGRVWRNLGEILAAGGATAADVTTLRIFVTSLDAYRQAGSALGGPWQEVFGRHLPAITMVQVAGLVDGDALLEVEAEAVIGGSA